MKLLGFIFSTTPNCNDQVSFLIRKATKKVFILCYYAGFMEGKDLLKLYCTMVRSVLEYSSVVYHSQISKYQ